MTEREYREGTEDKLDTGEIVCGEEVPAVKKRKLRELIQHGIRYSIVGTSSAAIELLLFYVLFNVLGVYVVASNIIALTVAGAYNFTMSRKWTFKSISSLSRSLLLYIALLVWNQIFSSWVIVGFMQLGLSAMLAKILTMLCIVSWNFVLYRKVVFR